MDKLWKRLKDQLFSIRIFQQQNLSNKLKKGYGAPLLLQLIDQRRMVLN